jgi:hypothetical protein
MAIRYGITIAALVGSLAGSAAAQLDPTDLDADGLPGVTEPVAGEEVPEVFALQGTGSILIDRSHLEGFNVNGFMGFLQSQGWTVTQNEEYPITIDILASHDVVIIPTALNSVYPFSLEEVEAFSTYLDNGGGLWLFHDSLNDPSGINSLSIGLGVSFYNDQVRDSTDNEGAAFWPRISDLQDHPITKGVTSYGYYGGCCLAATTPAQSVASGDEDAYSATCPSAPPVLAAYESAGRVVFAGDITPLHPNYYPSQLRDEEELLLQNIANWLAHLDAPNAVESETWGRVKARFR